jgi:subtilisin family serine protease
LNSTTTRYLMVTPAMLCTGTVLPTLRAPEPDEKTATIVALDLVGLRPVMELTTGSPQVGIGLVDGPIALEHPGLQGANIRELTGGAGSGCSRAGSLACRHGTFVAGILCANRNSAAPAICPGCSLLVRPIFSEQESAGDMGPSATPEQLAWAISECVGAGARIVNVSAGLGRTPSAKGERALLEALDHAARRGVIVVAAAGNQGMLGSTIITRHPWVMAVTACDREGNPLRDSNLGNSIGRRGLRAPGKGITSLGTDGELACSGGTSVAAPFVTGALALAWSQFPQATAGQIRLAVTQAQGQRRPGLVPALLNARAIYKALEALQ